MVQVSAEEAKTRLSDLIEEAVKGEAVYITQDGGTILQLVLVSSTQNRPQFGSARGLITIRDDFDEPLEEFEEYMP